VQEVRRHRFPTELRRVRLPEDDRAGPLQPFDDHGVVLGDEVGEELRAERRRDARDVREVLDRDRYAVERADRFTRPERSLGLRRRGPGRLVADRRVRVDLVVSLLDSVEKCSTTATGESSPRRIRAASSVAGVYERSMLSDAGEIDKELTHLEGGRGSAGGRPRWCRGRRDRSPSPAPWSAASAVVSS
jgi:hypothetical protein